MRGLTALRHLGQRPVPLITRPRQKTIMPSTGTTRGSSGPGLPTRRSPYLTDHAVTAAPTTHSSSATRMRRLKRRRIVQTLALTAVRRSHRRARHRSQPPARQNAVGVMAMAPLAMPTWYPENPPAVICACALGTPTPRHWALARSLTLRTGAPGGRCSTTRSARPTSAAGTSSTRTTSEHAATLSAVSRLIDTDPVPGAAWRRGDPPAAGTGAGCDAQPPRMPRSTKTVVRMALPPVGHRSQRYHRRTADTSTAAQRLQKPCHRGGERWPVKRAAAGVCVQLARTAGLDERHLEVVGAIGLGHVRGALHQYLLGIRQVTQRQRAEPRRAGRIVGP